MPDRIIKYTVPESFAGRKISVFLQSVHFSQKLLASLRQCDTSITVDGIPRHMNYIPDKSCEVHVCLPDESIDAALRILPTKMDLDILFEDEDLLVINKPANLPIHPSRANHLSTLANGVIYHYEEKGEEHVFRCINRLDKDTSGLTIIAKNRIAAGILCEQVQTRQIYREYTAVVEGTLLGSGTVALPIGRDSAEGSILRRIDHFAGQRAVTHYEGHPLGDNLSLVRLHLDTGRTHQIRVHMKAIGHPLIGDVLYNPDNHLLERHALHAGVLEFTHPIFGEKLKFTSELPSDMAKFINA